MHGEVEIRDPGGRALGLGLGEAVSGGLLQSKTAESSCSSHRLFRCSVLALAYAFPTGYSYLLLHNEEKMSLGLFNGEKRSLTGFSSSFLNMCHNLTNPKALMDSRGGREWQGADLSDHDISVECQE